jgi:hypothetical protein
MMPRAVFAFENLWALVQEKDQRHELIGSLTQNVPPHGTTNETPIVGVAGVATKSMANES